MRFGAIPVEGFLDRLAAPEPTPGGGTASALAAATGCALGEMVLGLTLGKEKFAAAEGQLAPLLPQLRALRERCLRLADQDSAAYDGFVRASKLPKATPEEQAARKRAMQDASRVAAEVPLATAHAAVEALEALALLARLGNPNARSDAITGALHAWAAFHAARLNVLANLDGLGDPALAAGLRAELDKLAPRAERLLAEARA